MLLLSGQLQKTTDLLDGYRTLREGIRVRFDRGDNTVTFSVYEERTDAIGERLLCTTKWSWNVIKSVVVHQCMAPGPRRQPNMRLREVFVALVVGSNAQPILPLDDGVDVAYGVKKEPRDSRHSLCQRKDGVHQKWKVEQQQAQTDGDVAHILVIPPFVDVEVSGESRTGDRGMQAATILQRKIHAFIY